MEDYRKFIHELIAKKAAVDIAEVQDDMYLEDDLNLGEMDLIELWSDIEEKLEIVVDEDEKEGVETVQEIVDLVDDAV